MQTTQVELKGQKKQAATNPRGAILKHRPAK